MAEGGLPDAHDWSALMAKRATDGDRGPKVPTLKVVGGTPNPRPISLDGDVEAHIGGRLRAMYDSVLREPVPDRFLDLLRQLDTKITSHENGGDTSVRPSNGTAKPKQKGD